MYSANLVSALFLCNTNILEVGAEKLNSETYLVLRIERPRGPVGVRDFFFMCPVRHSYKGCSTFILVTNYVKPESWVWWSGGSVHETMGGSLCLGLVLAEVSD